jgi:CRP-like cAMP-binding protein
MYITYTDKSKNMSQVQEILDTFFKQYPTSTYPKNQTLVLAGETTDFFYYVETGAVKMSKQSLDGRALVLHIFFPKSFFSLLSLVANDQNEYDFITFTSNNVRKGPRAD